MVKKCCQSLMKVSNISTLSLIYVVTCIQLCGRRMKCRSSKFDAQSKRHAMLTPGLQKVIQRLSSSYLGSDKLVNARQRHLDRLLSLTHVLSTIKDEGMEIYILHSLSNRLHSFTGEV